MDSKSKVNAWNEKGEIAPNAPKWALYRQVMTNEFPLPVKGPDRLKEVVIKGMDLLNDLKNGPDGPVFLGKDSKLQFQYPEVKNQKIAQKGMPIDDVIKEVVHMFEGGPNWGHPLTMENVLPNGNTAGIAASMLSQIYAPNIMEGEYGQNAHRAELETAGMIASLIGWDPTLCGGIFTWGGSGCWTYGVKYGLTRCRPDSRWTGMHGDMKVICSEQAHYVQQNSTDWLGIGMDNLIRIPCDRVTNGMDLEALDSKMKELHEKGIPVAVVVSTMGTTDASAFDDPAKIREIIDKYPNPKGHGDPLLYCDCVVGWSWLSFKEYDFSNNPLEFSKAVLNIIKHNTNLYKGIIHADAVGIDFHKVGWCPYVSSMFLYKDAEVFEKILVRGKDSYLQVRTPYNPMYYTLEVSRTVNGAMAAWATLKYFGLEGLQAIVGGIEEVKYVIYDLVEQRSDMCVANEGDSGFITLIRVYPPDVDAKQMYENELNNPEYRQYVMKYNRLNETIGNKLYAWYREAHRINGICTPYMSFSTGFRTTNYNREENDPDAVIFAIKSFPMTVFCTPDVMKHTLDCVAAARDEVLKEWGEIK